MAMAAAIDGQAAAEQAALAARIGRRDREALHELAELYARPMRRLAWRLLFDEGEAEAVVAQAFARFWAAAPRWRDGGRIGAWFYRTCTTLCLERLRRREDKQADPAAEDEAECLAALAPRARAAIVLTRCEALPNAAVAEILDMRLSAFEELLSQGRIAMQACLRRNMIRPELLNHYLDELRPNPPPAGFAAAIAEAASRTHERRDGNARDRRGAWILRDRAALGSIAAALLVAGSLAALVARGGSGEVGGKPAAAAPAPASTVRVAVDEPAAPAAPAIAAEAPAPAPSLTPAPRPLASRPPLRPALAEPVRRRAVAAQAAPRATQRAKAFKEPIPLLPENFAKMIHPPEAMEVEDTVDRRASMRAYLRTLTAQELDELRQEERALARERGLAELPPR